MTLNFIRQHFFSHEGQEYEVQAAIIDHPEVRLEATVFIRVLDRDRNTIRLHYDGPDLPPRTAVYDVPMSVQTANLNRLLEHDTVSEVMQLAEDDVKRLL